MSTVLNARRLSPRRSPVGSGGQGGSPRPLQSPRPSVTPDPTANYRPVPTIIKPRFNPVDTIPESTPLPMIEYNSNHSDNRDEVQNSVALMEYGGGHGGDGDGGSSGNNSSSHHTKKSAFSEHTIRTVRNLEAPLGVTPRRPAKIMPQQLSRLREENLLTPLQEQQLLVRNLTSRLGHRKDWKTNKFSTTLVFDEKNITNFPTLRNAFVAHFLQNDMYYIINDRFLTLY